MSAFDLSRYFSPDEFRCRCCGSLGIGIADELILLLDNMREELGAPIIVSSGYRCESHNAYCGGVKNSQHLYGRAADIWTPKESVTVDALAWLALAMSDGGHSIGLGRYYDSGFIHVDVRGWEARW